MSLSSVSSALSLNERWVLLHRQPRGPRKGPPRLLLIPPLRSPILQGADSSKIREPASPPPAQPHFPIITTTTKVGGFLFTVLSSQHTHPPYITLNQNEPQLCILTVLAHISASCLTLFLSEGRTLMLFASLASDSSIPAEGKGERRDLPGLLAAPICQTHPAHWFTFTARIYGMPGTKRVEAARITRRETERGNYSKQWLFWDGHYACTPDQGVSPVTPPIHHDGEGPHLCCALILPGLHKGEFS